MSTLAMNGFFFCCCCFCCNNFDQKVWMDEPFCSECAHIWVEYRSEQWLAAWRCVRDEYAFYSGVRAIVPPRQSNINQMVGNWNKIASWFKAIGVLHVSGYRLLQPPHKRSWELLDVACAFAIAHDDQDCSSDRYENAPSQSNTYTSTLYLCPTATQTIKTNKIVVYAIHNTYKFEWIEKKSKRLQHKRHYTITFMDHGNVQSPKAAHTIKRCAAYYLNRHCDATSQHWLCFNQYSLIHEAIL